MALKKVLGQEDCLLTMKKTSSNIKRRLGKKAMLDLVGDLQAGTQAWKGVRVASDKAESACS
eukprot:1146372-Pelagomonas_calceolata.AAC.3